MQDDLIHFGQKTSIGHFFQVGQGYMKPTIQEKNADLVGQTRIYLTAEELVHKRKVFDIIALLGTLGGVTGIIRLSFGFFFFPIS